MAAPKSEWFSVDRDGLAKQLADVPTWRLLAELLQNAWDEQSTRVTLTIERAITRGYYQVTVTDDNPDGFKDLSHAWTLFAPSTKGGNAEQRGRFNMGEKLLLAAARSALIRTTTGAVVFNENGRRVTTAGKTISGSVVEVVMKIKDLDDVAKNLQRLVAPVPTFLQIEYGDHVNLKQHLVLSKDETIRQLGATLPTVITNDQGEFTRTERTTTVRVYAVGDNRPAAIYEMGIPVVDVDLPWSVDVQQKVPLNRDRDNVTPGYLAALRVLVFNGMTEDLTAEDFRSDWARAAAGDDSAAPAAVEQSLDSRFGKQRVAYDPTDQEANRLAMAKGYTVVPGGAMSKGEWTNAKASGSIAPAGQVTPSPKPYSDGGQPLKTIHPDKWTQAMTDTAVMATRLAQEIGIGNITVQMANEISWPFGATFGTSKQLVLNVGRLGHKWFNVPTNLPGILNLLIHEFGHYDGSSHLSEAYYDNLTRFGAATAVAALDHPEWFRPTK